MLNLLWLGQKWVQIEVGTLAHTCNILDNPLTRYKISWHKELFAFNFWCLYEDTVSKLEKPGQFFQVSIHFHPLHPWLQTTKNSFFALQWSLATKLQTSFIVLKFD